MKDLTGRVERLERRVIAQDDGLIILTVRYGEELEQAQQER